MKNVSSIAESALRRDVGMERAVEHADRACAFWSEEAYGHLFDLCMNLNAEETFLTEDVRVFAEARGLQPPPDGRAWGAVMRRASKYGLIRRLGYAPARSSNLLPKCLWGVAA